MSQQEMDDSRDERPVGTDSDGPGESEREGASAPDASDGGDAHEPAGGAGDVDRIEISRAELEELRQRAGERDRLLDELLRTKADFDNYQKRIRRERPAWEEQAVGRFIVDLLSVVDDFERALGSIESKEGASVEGLEAGVRLIHQKLLQVLARHDVEEIPAERERFDPELHEAMVQEPVEDRPTGEVTTVLEKGYRRRSTVLRPSKVMVALNVKESEAERDPD